MRDETLANPVYVSQIVILMYHRKQEVLVV